MTFSTVIFINKSRFGKLACKFKSPPLNLPLNRAQNQSTTTTIIWNRLPAIDSRVCREETEEREGRDRQREG